MKLFHVKKYKDFEKYQKVNALVVLFVMIIIGSLSIGYSVLSQTLAVQGTVTLRTQKDIRVQSIGTFTSGGGAYENYNPTYTEDSITTNVVLPSLTSTATYTVTIKNTSSTNKTIDTITNELYNNSDIVYELSGASAGTKILANDTLTFTITFKYASSVTSLPASTSLGANIKFTFADESVTLLDYAKANQVVTSNDGLYNTATDTYIYKGTTVNNYIKFSGDTALYRIIGYLPDGTMKVFAADFTNNLAWDAGGNRTVAASPYCTNATTNGCNYFGTTTTGSLTYTNNLAVTTDSTVKVWLDNWYSTIGFKNKIQLHDFNGGFVKTSETPAAMVSDTANIIYNTHVALVGVDDVFNAFVTMPTTTISTSVTYSNTANYFFAMESNAQQMWLLNPSTYDTWDVWSVAYGTQFGQKRASRTSQANGSVTSLFYVHPCFYLLSNQTFTGTGTSADPFVISQT